MPIPIVQGDTAGGDLQGTFPNPTIRNGVITAAKIQALTITNDEIADGTLSEYKLRDQARLVRVSGNQIVSGIKVFEHPRLFRYATQSFDMVNKYYVDTKVASGTGSSGGGGFAGNIGSGTPQYLAKWISGLPILNNSLLYEDAGSVYFNTTRFSDGNDSQLALIASGSNDITRYVNLLKLYSIFDPDSADIIGRFQTPLSSQYDVYTRKGSTDRTNINALTNVNNTLGDTAANDVELKGVKHKFNINVVSGIGTNSFTGFHSSLVASNLRKQITNFYGHSSELTTVASGVLVKNKYDYYVSQLAQQGITERNVGLYIESAKNNNVINNYGIFIEHQLSGGAIAYSIYSVSGNHYFGGNVQTQKLIADIISGSQVFSPIINTHRLNTGLLTLNGVTYSGIPTGGGTGNGNITGSGTPGYIAKFITASGITNSILFESADAITLFTSIPASGSFGGITGAGFFLPDGGIGVANGRVWAAGGLETSTDVIGNAVEAADNSSWSANPVVEKSRLNQNALDFIKSGTGNHTGSFNLRGNTFVSLSDNVSAVDGATSQQRVNLIAITELRNRNQIRFRDASDSQYALGLRAPVAISGTGVIWNLPDRDGTPGQAIFTDGSGSFYWGTASGTGGTGFISGSGLGNGVISYIPKFYYGSGITNSIAYLNKVHELIVDPQARSITSNDATLSVVASGIPNFSKTNLLLLENTSPSTGGQSTPSSNLTVRNNLVVDRTESAFLTTISASQQINNVAPSPTRSAPLRIIGVQSSITYLNNNTIRSGVNINSFDSIIGVSNSSGVGTATGYKTSHSVASGSTISTLYGLYVSGSPNSIAQTGYIDRQIGVYVATGGVTASGTTTKDNIGVYLEHQLSGINIPYSIYSVSGNHYFGGNVQSQRVITDVLRLGGVDYTSITAIGASISGSGIRGYLPRFDYASGISNSVLYETNALALVVDPFKNRTPTNAFNGAALNIILSGSVNGTSLSKSNGLFIQNLMNQDPSQSTLTNSLFIQNAHKIEDNFSTPATISSIRATHTINAAPQATQRSNTLLIQGQEITITYNSSNTIKSGLNIYGNLISINGSTCLSGIGTINNIQTTYPSLASGTETDFWYGVYLSGGTIGNLGGLVQKSYGLYLQSFGHFATSGSRIKENVGIFLEHQLSGSQSAHAIYSTSGNHYMGGNIRSNYQIPDTDFTMTPKYYADKNMVKTKLDTQETFTIPTDYQIIAYGQYILSGTMIASGSLVIL